MTKHITVYVVLLAVILFVVQPVIAGTKSKESYYYKSAKTGKFVPKSDAKNRPTSTYKSRK